MPTTVLLTESYHPLLLDTLSTWPAIHLYSLPNPTYPALTAILPEIELWIARGAIPIDESLLSHAPKLRLILRAGSGTEHIDKEALARRGIALRSTPQANAAPVAEYVVAAILSLSRGFLPAHHALREKNTWQRKTFIGRELPSLKIGVMGFGENGSRTARLLVALGATVLAYDKYKSGFGGNGIHEVPLETLYEEAEVVSLHVPLTPETRGWVDESFFKRFSRPIALINAARGGIVSLPALAQALAEGKVWGAAIDTLPNEPPENLSPADLEAWTYLRQHPAVLLTPHIAGLSQESELRLAQAVLTALRTFLDSSSYP